MAPGYILVESLREAECERKMLGKARRRFPKGERRNLAHLQVEERRHVSDYISRLVPFLAQVIKELGIKIGLLADLREVSPAWINEDEILWPIG
jgi:hypothetical protein